MVFLNIILKVSIYENMMSFLKVSFYTQTAFIELNSMFNFSQFLTQ